MNDKDIICGEWITVPTKCPICASEKSIPVVSTDYKAWQNGAFVQNAFPYLDDDNRERLVTGTCNECWDNMFAFEDDDAE